MTITAKLADGTELNFPDGTNPAVIQRTVKSVIAQKANPASDKQAMLDRVAAAKASGGLSPQRAAEQSAIDAAHSPAAPDPGAMGAFVSGADQGLTLGFADEINAGLEGGANWAFGLGQPYDEALKKYRAQYDKAASSHPVANFSGQAAGALAPILLSMGMASPEVAMTEGGIAAAEGGGLAAPAAVRGIRGGMARRAAAGSAAGATQGGLYSFGTGEGGFANRATNAAGGAMAGAALGGIIPALGAGVQRAFDNSATRKAIKAIVKNAPSTETLRDMGSRAYKAVDDAGVTILPSSMRGATNDIISSMKASGLDDTGGMLSLTPKSARVAQLLDEAPATNAPIPFSAVDQLRRKAGIAASDIGNKTDAMLGSKAISGLDDFIKKLAPSDVASGDATDLAANIGKARDIWAKMSRSQLLDDAIAAGHEYVSGTGSGIRLQFSRILKNPKLVRGFSDTEKAVMRKVANGSIPEKMLQMAGSGIGNIATMAGGLAGGGLPGMLAGGVVSGGVRKAADALTARRAEFARAFIAGGGMPEKVKASPKAVNAIETMIMNALRPAFPGAGQILLGQTAPQPR